MGGISKFRYSAIPTRFLDPYGLVKCICCKHGSFAGEAGNSVFTPDDPSKWGLQPGQGIPFNNGIPDFGEFAESVLGLPKEFNVPGLTGHSGKDYQAIVRHMAGEAGVIQKDITDIIGRKGRNLRLHHAGGDRVQVVPHETHKLSHHGGAKELRDACK